jgi:hypothetical protein
MKLYAARFCRAFVSSSAKARVKAGMSESRRIVSRPGGSQLATHGNHIALFVMPHRYGLPAKIKLREQLRIAQFEPELVQSLVGQLEIHQDLGFDRHRVAVEVVRLVLPLADGFDGGTRQNRISADNFQILDVARLADRGL